MLSFQDKSYSFVAPSRNTNPFIQNESTNIDLGSKYSPIGSYKSNGRANESTVLKGPGGGFYYLNTKGNLTNIPIFNHDKILLS